MCGNDRPGCARSVLARLCPWLKDVTGRGVTHLGGPARCWAGNPPVQRAPRVLQATLEKGTLNVAQVRRNLRALDTAPCARPRSDRAAGMAVGGRDVLHSGRRENGGHAARPAWSVTTSSAPPRPPPASAGQGLAPGLRCACHDDEKTMCEDGGLRTWRSKGPRLPLVASTPKCRAPSAKLWRALSGLAPRRS